MNKFNEELGNAQIQSEAKATYSIQSINGF